VDAAERQHYNLTFAVLALAAAAFSLLQSLVAPALPEIQRDLHASAAGATWILTAYLLAASVTTPIAGRLGDMFGKEHMLLAVLAILAVGTVISALATSLPLMIVGRLIQGAGGAVFPLAFGIIRDEFPRERVASGIALMSAILGVGGGAGIVLAGPIVQHLGYHWLFWLPLVAVLLALVATHFFVPESPVKTPGRVNWLGAILLSGWLVCLLVGVSQGPHWGWGSVRVVGLFAGAVVLFAAWILAELRAPEPLVDMRMMRLRAVWATNVATVLIGFGMFTSFVLVPQLVETPASTGYGFGASVTEAGLFLLPSTVAMLLVSPIAGRMTQRVGGKVPLVLGAAVSALAFVLLAAAHGRRIEIYAATTVLGIGIGLAFSSMANVIVAAVPPEQTGVATGMNTIMRSIGGAIGGQIAASILTANVGLGGFPTGGGYTVAFAVAAASLGVGVLAALLVPGRAAAGAPHGELATAPPS
jgi:EmrB/QacA subfamily drug resistance transporter